MLRALVRSILLAMLFQVGLAPAGAAQAWTAGQSNAGLTSHRGGQAGGMGAASAAGKKGGHRQKRHAPPAVTLGVTAGYGESYRDSAWIPVRVTARNRSANTISGTLEIPDGSTSGNNQGCCGPPAPYRALYQMSVVLPGDATKQVTLYVPAASIGNGLDVQLRDAGGVLASGSDSPTTFDRASLSVGALTSDPASINWIKHIEPQTGSPVSLVQLTPDMVDPLPQALANFDLIVVNDGSVARLDRDQLAALEQYVRNGGALVLVGGPGWQETLRPLPADLIPGHLTGTRTVPTLLGLMSIQKVAPPKRENPTGISVLRDPQGTVLASTAGVPLAVQAALGTGQLLYLAFDPSLDPVAHWSASSRIMTRLFVRAAPAAVGRTSLPQGTSAPSLFFNSFGPPMNIAGELDNVPAAALPSILLFIILTVLYILLLGPLNFLVLRRFRRREFMWVTIPLGAILCMGATLGVAYHLKGSTVLINTVGMVTLDGRAGPHPAALYVGLFAPVRGDYQLTYGGQALPQYVPQFNYYGGGPGQPGPGPLGLRFQEGSQTQVQFLGLNMWSMRNVALHTTVNVAGRVQSQLHIDRHGFIVGAVHNDTPLTLIHPAIIAGRTILHLADMPPEKTIPVRIKPNVDIYDNNYSPFWSQMYGQSQCCGGGFFSRGPVCFNCQGPSMGGNFFGGDYLCCPGPSAPQEHNFNDRVRNAVTQLPDAQSVSALGEILFVAWNQQPLGSIQVDGAAPQRRDLNLIVSPLSAGIAPGPFTLRTGTIGANLVNLSPQQTQNGCCWPPGPNSIYLGSGGSATFEFDLPRARHLHFNHLWLNVDAGGALGADLGRVWDWRAGKWVTINLDLGYAALGNPNRFISSHGALLLKLVPGDFSNDIRITDIHRNLQISGDGVAA